MTVTISGTNGIDKVQDGIVSLSKLSASGTPGNNNFLRGDNSWQTQRIVGISSIVTNSTSTDFSGLNNFGAANVYYIHAAALEISYTKLSATSTIFVNFNYNFRSLSSGSGVHSFVVYSNTNPTTNYKIIGSDLSRIPNASTDTFAVSSSVPFAGMAAGTHTFRAVPCRATADTIGQGINGGPNSDNSTPTTSWIYITEVEI